LITSRIGSKWIKQLDDLKKLEKFADDEAFRRQWQEAKLAAKTKLSEYIKTNFEITINPESIFDIQVKRIHEYKRQLLNALRIIALYNRVKKNPKLEICPRTFIFGGKAAPGYFMAKLIIKLINSVGDVVNRDKDVKDLLKVVYLPDYNVKFGQRVYPAADLSEQISTAGKEASGTSNMKFSLNGALTMGTLDGANIEIREEVGAENFFLFGLSTDEVLALKTKGYNPYDYYNTNAELKQVIDQISSGFFSFGDKDLFRPIVDSLMHSDEYMLFADFQAYMDCQDRVDAAYKDQDQWAKMSILNVARMGKFSSDRSIREYCQEIWKTEAVEIEMKDYDQGSAGLSVPPAPEAPGGWADLSGPILDGSNAWSLLWRFFRWTGLRHRFGDRGSLRLILLRLGDINLVVILQMRAEIKIGLPLISLRRAIANQLGFLYVCRVVS
jgi:starch phosphorylase